MIYELPELAAPIRQGDIFVGIPRVDFSLHQIPVIDESGEQSLRSWTQLANTGDELTAVFAMRSVSGIVISQDCDNVRSPDITLCEIRNFRDVERKAKDVTSPKKWKSILTQHARLNQKWFYLPPDHELGFDDKMAVDFMVTIRLPRADLESMRQLRRGRLNSMADEHFRERISEFFRRYPYDEWYALDSHELAVYRQEYPEAQPYPWQ